ncbi:glycosyl transferase [Phaeobacter gallaeciensis]|uniref:Glycosyl transferase n=2 Tax=Roseobacteraceae TaxID=2854170 RepID=A0A366X088_9RHOB|nr:MULTISPECIES: glycosyltransferase [Roseobacteraceae]MBT3143434.1 glycosyltransferase [Falsiruegeria litorea]MBT8167720.1 glycosyltransferase [Falsiruegeria litorea]RBW55606.1 glycosyl transferase [Phaeobacter gallaeciensis]
MSEQHLRLVSSTPALALDQTHQRLGRHLVGNGIITQQQLVKALHLQLRLKAPIGEIIVAEGWASKRDILEMLSLQFGVQLADLEETPPTKELCDVMPAEFWLEHRVVPWMRLGPILLIATSRPDHFHLSKSTLQTAGVIALPVLADEEQIVAALAAQYKKSLAAAAEERVDRVYSCRTWQSETRIPAIVASICLAAATYLIPTLVLTALFLVAVATLLLFSTLKLISFVVYLQSKFRASSQPDTGLSSKGIGFRLPKVSVMVPLYKEREIASALITRLGRLTYPKALLDVVLVLEEKDHITNETVARTELPSWIRVIRVPEHTGLTTKPRAMNYALDFCKGDIIGVWDAEDAPMPDQIQHVVERFNNAPDDVVCLQGILDYYNPRSSWRARCFTIEYSSWFRVILPGIARMKLVVPLGGTTLFFKRKVLEELGGWDAHNVTEDADLGVRLCRAGYRTELIDTVTFEEANFRTWPWVKQRSRWLKGFMVTYLVHMRSPSKLWADLGARRFFGLQAFFLGTLGQFLLAPVLWSFWLILFGLPHPVQAALPASFMTFSVGVFVATELLALAVGIAAVTSSKRHFLVGWVPSMVFYFPLGVLAAYKALYELVSDPFFWDKTQHGQAVEEVTDPI